MPNAGPQLTGSLSLDDSDYDAKIKKAEKSAKGMAAKLAGLTFKISTTGINVATKALKGFAATLTSIGKGGLSGLGASFLMGGWQGLGGSIAAVGQKMTAGIVDAYEYGRSLEILSRNTGFSAKSMSIFKVAMEDAGVTMELFQRTSRMIAKEVNLGMHGDQAATAGMEQIGLHVKELMKLAPEQQFMAVGNAIAAIENPTMQAAAAVSRFGSESAKMLSFFKNPEALKNAAEAVGSQAEIFERSGKTFEKIAVRIGHIKVKAMGFFAEAAETIMPMVDKFSAMFDKMDFASWGAKLGSAINKAMAWVVTFFNEPGKTTAYFWEYAKVEAMELGNVLVDAAFKFGEALVDAIKGAGLNGMLIAGGMNFGAAVLKEAGGAGGKGGKDHMGAGDARQRLAAMRPNAAFEQARGALGLNRTMVDAGSLPDTTTPWRFRGFHGTGGLLEKGRFHSSLVGASMSGYLGQRDSQTSPGMRGTGSLSSFHQTAYGQSNLLRHGELNKFRNARVAMGLEQRRPGETANGDRQRAKAVRVELERKKQHAGSSEQLLSDISEYTEEVAKNTRPFVN